MVRWTMIIDLNKCIGCEACTVACKAYNATTKGVYWNRLVRLEKGTYPSVSRAVIPRPCMHCENPPCVDICPTGASYKRDDGIVMINADKCIGCKYCIAACPYGVRVFIGEVKNLFSSDVSVFESHNSKKHQSGVVEKCNFCFERVEKGLQPACVQTCPPDARYFGDADNPESDVYKILASNPAPVLRPEMGTKPNVFYPGLQQSLVPPLREGDEVLPPNTLLQVKDILKPVAAVAVGTVVVAASVNFVKTIRKSDKGGD